MVLIKNIDYKQIYYFNHNKDFFYLILDKYLKTKYHKVLKIWFNSKYKYCETELFTIKQLHKLKALKFNNIKIFRITEQKRLNNFLKKPILSYLNFMDLTNCFELYYNTLKDLKEVD